MKLLKKKYLKKNKVSTLLQLSPDECSKEMEFTIRIAKDLEKQLFNPETSKKAQKELSIMAHIVIDGYIQGIKANPEKTIDMLIEDNSN